MGILLYRERDTMVELQKIKILFIIGESGCGKDFLAEKICESPSLCHRVILTTTRPIREHEIQDEDYHYVKDAEFQDMVEKGKIGGVKYFNGWGYGVQYEDLHPHKINICVISPKAMVTFIKDLFEKYKEFSYKIVKIQTTDKIRLIRQLNREENPNVEEIIRRFNADKADFLEEKSWGLMEELVNNSEPDGGASALRALRSILMKLK